MGLHYFHLDADTRANMLTEIDHDISARVLYISDRLSPRGAASYPHLIKEAASSGTDDSLSQAIRPLLNSHQKPRRMRGGRVATPVMPINAHETLAEGEFNRFYMRALCLRALGAGETTVEVYRAKHVGRPRPDSRAKVGLRIDAQRVLELLRAKPSVDTALGLPPGPSSGLSVKL